jgi:hypothetical protein
MTDSYPKTELPDGSGPICDASPNYERTADGSAMDETDVNLRAYFSRLTEDHLCKYDATWSDAELIVWDGNFTSDGSLFLVCSEREIEPTQYRRALEEHLRMRGLSSK